MSQFILRKNPFFELTLNESSFEINNSDYQYKNGIYNIDEIKSIELISKKLDWFSTIFGNLIGFFLGGQAGYEIDEAKFKFRFYSSKKMEVKLIDCDLKVAEKFLKQIQHSKLQSNPFPRMH